MAPQTNRATKGQGIQTSLAGTLAYEGDDIIGKPINISRGLYPGASIFGGFGRLEAASGVTKNIVWPNGPFDAPSTAGEAITFVSSDDEDGAGTSTGILTMEVHYLDVDLIPQDVIITLNGTTPVTGQLTGCRFIQDMHIMTAGSIKAAVGIIKAYKAGAATTIYNLIAAGSERAESSLRMVPKSKKAFFAGAVVSAISGAGAARVELQAVASEVSDHQYVDPFILIPFTGIGVQDGGAAPVNLPVNPVFSEGTVIGIRATSDKAATISATWFGWLEPVTA